MLKKIFTACAGVLLTGAMTFAENLNGVYSGQANGEAIAITLQSNGEAVRGSVSFHGATIPLAGRQSDGQVQGVWQAPTGQNIPFVAAMDGASLQLQTNGVTYSLNRQQTQTSDRNPGPEFRAVDEDQDRSPAPIRQGAQPVAFNSQMARSDIFAFPVPQGWNHNEGTNAVFVCSPDASMMIGFTGLERVNTGTPIQFLHYMMEKVHNLPISQLVSCDRVPFQGGEAIEAVWITRRANGCCVKSWARVAIVQGYGSNGYVLMASATPDQFDRVIGGLKAMAEKIQIINPARAFQRDAALAVQQNTNYNHPMDHSFAQGYWDRQKTTDAVIARGSDVRRDTYVSTDPHTGTPYWHNGSAYDNSGRVVNPERPNEYLNEASHWQNH